MDNKLLLKWIENYIGTVIGKKANVAFCELDYATAGVIVLQIKLGTHIRMSLVVLDDYNISIINIVFCKICNWFDCLKTWFEFCVIGT